MTYRRNFFSYFNFLGISFCIFIAWASYFGYKSLVINGLLAFFVFCVLKCVMFAKFKNDDELCIFLNNIKIENTAAGRQNERISRWEDY